MTEGDRATYLSRHQLDLVVMYWTPYLEAVAAVGLPAPWAFALAGMHNAESGFASGSPRGEQGGPFCFDPAGRGYPGTLAEQIRTHVTKVGARYSRIITDPSLETDMRSAALVAADELKEKVKPVPLMGGDYPSLRDAIGWALWGYNGRAHWCSELFQTGKGSDTPVWRWAPYVVNDPANGVQLYAGTGSVVGADGSRTSTGGRRPASNPGALIVADELHARWHQWYPNPTASS